MSCGFCHVGPNPSNPPADPENPTWANLNSNPGAQYFWIDRIFMWDPKTPDNFIFQLFHTSRPGALDTSLVSSDQINNPRTMNAVYNLGARLEIARRWGKEKLAGGGARQQAVQRLRPGRHAARRSTTTTPDTVSRRTCSRTAPTRSARSARSTASSSTSACSARSGCCTSSRWSAAADITPIKIADARARTPSYWNANEPQTPDTGAVLPRQRRRRTT